MKFLRVFALSLIVLLLTGALVACEQKTGTTEPTLTPSPTESRKKKTYSDVSGVFSIYYAKGMKLSNLTIFFDNLTTKSSSDKYDNYAFDFIIVWPIQSVTKNEKEIQMLKEMAERQKTKKIIYLTIKEPWYNPDSLDSIVDRVIKLDCENDDPKEYQRILAAYEEDMKRRY
jgi:hypothetical protein